FGSSSVASMRMVVVFPAPFGPTKPMTSPDENANETPSTATVFPNRLRRPTASKRIALAPFRHADDAARRAVRVRTLERRVGERRRLQHRGVHPRPQHGARIVDDALGPG